jgi:hypothetical protein
MTRRAISITLDAGNVAWLKGRAGVSGDSVSGMIDQLVTAARQGHCVGEARSVVGTIDIDSSDPLLEKADAALQAAFAASLNRPLAVREARAAYTPKPARRPSRRPPRG